jgi:hypothetical protein
VRASLHHLDPFYDSAGKDYSEEFQTRLQKSKQAIEALLNASARVTNRNT